MRRRGKNAREHLARPQGTITALRVVDAIRAGAAGKVLFGEAYLQQVLDEFSQQQSEETALTPWQESIVSGIIAGKANKGIAGDLALAEKTVKNQTREVFAALGVRDRTEAALKALRRGIGSKKAVVEPQTLDRRS